VAHSVHGYKSKIGMDRTERSSAHFSIPLMAILDTPGSCQGKKGLGDGHVKKRIALQLNIWWLLPSYRRRVLARRAEAGARHAIGPLLQDAMNGRLAFGGNSGYGRAGMCGRPVFQAQATLRTDFGQHGFRPGMR